MDKVETRAIELTDEANDIISGVNDLVSVRKIDASEVGEDVRDGKERVETVVDDLKTLDESKTALLEKTKSDIQTMKTYLADIESMLKKGDLSIKNFSMGSVKSLDSYQALMDGFTSEESSGSVGFASLFEKMIDGNTLTAKERDMVYNFIQNVIINNDVRADMQELVGMIDGDNAKDALANRVNNDVLTSEDSLGHEMALIQAYLYNGNEDPDSLELKDDRDKLQAYLSILGNYKTAINEVREEMNWSDQTDIPLFARAEYVDYEENDDPYTLTFKSEIKIWLHEESDHMTRSEYMDIDRPLIVRANESEVTYFRGNLSDVQLQNSQNEDLEEEQANYTSNFIGEEALQLLISNAGKYSGVLTAADTVARFRQGKEELTEELKMGEVKSTASALDMEIHISDRFKPGVGSDYVIQTHPTTHTFDLLDRWKEVHEINPNIPYPGPEIQKQNWREIASNLSGNESSFDEINAELSNYIINNKKDEDKTVEDIANEDQ